MNTCLRLLGCLLLLVGAPAAELATGITKADLDPAASAEWVGGKTIAIGPERLREGPSHLIWTSDGEAGWSGLEFGDTKQPGSRHLRLGFTHPIGVGTVVARGGSLSVLKPDAAYPGDPGDDSLWLAAQRVEGSAVVTTADAGAFATWVLPPGTTTRALRFTHIAKPTDRRYNGWVGGVWLFAGRFANLAPAGVAGASANADTAGRLNDQRSHGWDTWDNGTHGQEFPISPEHPAWVSIAWPQAQPISGLVALSVAASRIEAQVCTAPATVHPSQASESQWKTVVADKPADPLYPKPLGPITLEFPAPVTTRGVRLRFLAPLDEGRAHGHLHGKTMVGKRVWLEQLLALSPLGTAALRAPAPAIVEAAHPPIAVPFHLDRPGLVTLVIEDADGNRVRNLVAETRFPAGDNTAWWDGLDDRGRDYEAAEHHVYRIPGALVPPATCRVRGLVRDDVSLAYDFSFYTNGTPPWETADGSGWWLANHTPPQAAWFVRAGEITGGLAKEAGDCMLLGSAITEGGSGLAWVDLQGRKRYGIGWIGGVWTGAACITGDRGPQRVPGCYAYTGSAFEDELRLNGLKPEGGDIQVLKWKFPSKADADLAGIAAWNGVLVASLPKLECLLLVDIAGGRVLGRLPCPRPRGVAFDAAGRLLAVSAGRVVRLTLPADLIERCIGKPLDRSAWKATASSGEPAGAFDGKGDTRWDTHKPQRPGDWLQIDLGTRQPIGRIALNMRNSTGDFPRGLEISASDDGTSWGAPFIVAPGTAGWMELTFPTVTARWLKLVNTGTDNERWWSIDELDLYGSAGSVPRIEPQPLITAGLDEPEGLCTDNGRIYVSNRGKSHQVVVFGDDGRKQRAFGRAGSPATGPYDELHMNNPAGMAVDSRGRLWVTECDHQPKRVSVWRADGAFERAFYGPAQYGEGGTLDPIDRSRLYLMGMELALDWKAGTSAVKSVFWRPGTPAATGLGDWGFGPESPVRVGDRQYLTTTFNGHPTNCPDVVGIWKLEKGVATAVAAAGRARSWAPISDRLGRLATYSVRWTGQVSPAISGPVTFHTVSDDGVRLWVDGKPLIDNWTGHGATEDTGTVTLTAGKPVDIRLEWFQGAGGATIQLLWSGPGLARAIIPAANLIPPGQAAPGGLRGEYHEGTNFDRQRFVRTDATIDLNPPGGVLDLPGVGDDAAQIRSRLPAGKDFERDPILFVWSDLDHDGSMQPAELTFRAADSGGITVQPDLSLATATGLQFAAASIDAAGVPLYDTEKAVALVPGGRTPNTSGGGHTLVCPDGWTALTIPPESFPAQSSLSGAKGGVLKWTYPNLWPGLHPSHTAPLPDRPGMLIGTTRVLGQPFKPTGSDAGWCWAVNGNKGNVYVFTSDGLFVATLFKDSRLATRWAMPSAERGMRVEDTTLGEENFWPTMSQAADGRINLISGSSVVAVGGLESIRRLRETTLALTREQLARAQAWTLEQEAQRQRAEGGGTLRVALRAAAPEVDGDLADWAGSAWATIDRRREQEGDWGSRTELITGAVAVSGDRLYAAWRTSDANLLRNAGTTWQTLFKTGGCLDLMIGADPAAPATRAEPAAGDRRLLVTLVEGKPVAVLYSPVVPGHTGDRVPFASPVSTVLMDEVTRVESQIRLAGKNGDFELSVPLALLGLKPAAGTTIQADIGILRGNGFQTMQRAYWSNKATSITADVPSEARLSPNLWGRWAFTPAP